MPFRQRRRPGQPVTALNSSLLRLSKCQSLEYLRHHGRVAKHRHEPAGVVKTDKSCFPEYEARAESDTRGTQAGDKHDLPIDRDHERTAAPKGSPTPVSI